MIKIIKINFWMKSKKNKKIKQKHILIHLYLLHEVLTNLLMILKSMKNVNKLKGV